MDPHLSSITALAWCRELGVDDNALAVPGRVMRIDDTTDVLRVLTAGAATAVVGPARAVAAVDALGERPLDAAVVREATGGLAARTEVLGLCADWVDAARVRDPLISHDTAHLIELLRRCPPDDVDEADLAGSGEPAGRPGPPPDRVYVLLDDDHRPLAAAAYRELGSLVADLRALTAPPQRRTGLAATVATLCAHDALDDGLIPLWRARRDNIAARRLSAVLGYHEWGTLVTARVRAR